jgi:hypothetical protein
MDLFGDFSDLVEWLKEAEALDSSEAKKSLTKWDGKPGGERTLEKTLALRAVLRDMVERIAKGKSVGQSAIDEINNLLRNRTGYTQLVRARGGIERRFHLELIEPIQLITTIA